MSFCTFFFWEIFCIVCHLSSAIIKPTHFTIPVLFHIFINITVNFKSLKMQNKYINILSFVSKFYILLNMLLSNILACLLRAWKFIFLHIIS